FSDGGLYNTSSEAVERALAMVDEGADIIDIGGESTRPGANEVSVAEELERVIPVVEELAKRTNAWISIDTYKSEVAERAVKAGAHIINDISGLRFDEDMPAVAAKYGTPVIVIQGNPRNMQENPVYTDVVNDIKDYFSERIDFLQSQGIKRNNIVIDPGIGFGKTLEHNLLLLNRTKEFQTIGCPVMIGVSRKSFLGKILDLPPDERLEGTTAAVAVSIMNGAHIIRIHDVREMNRVSRVVDAIVTQI
ncbi:dihydropteroate synthase, partial [candidate division KSB1 bacterium]